MGQIIKSLMSFCQSLCKHSYGCNFHSILMKFCTVIRAWKVRSSFWDKNLITPSPILPQIFKNLHYSLWGHHSGTTRSPVKDNCMLFAPIPLYLGPGYPMVSLKFLPCRPLLLCNRPHERQLCRVCTYPPLYAAARLHSVALGQIPRSTERISS